MSGHRAGVKALILLECPKALYVHCCAHSLNLAVQDATLCVPLIRDVLSLVGDLNTVVRVAAKRYAIFQVMQKKPLALVVQHPKIITRHL